jgi:3-oxoacyl-[acyl-carrier-protein] synthase II
MNTQPIRIRGVGAVSSAGWSAAAMHQAVLAGTPLPAVKCVRPEDPRNWSCEARLAPAAPPEKITRHPRLRRSSAITRYSVSAALEALADAGHDPAAPPPGLGVLYIMMNGCVNYTGRFFQEVLQNPAQASPLIFPETVFNAPASHVASFLGIDGVVSTLVGSPNSIMEALDTATFWINSGIVEECLLIAGEECDWLSTEGLTYYHPDLVASEGAGAILLSASGHGPQVSAMTGPLGYLSWRERCNLLPELAAQTLAQLHGEATLIDDRTGIAKLDRAEAAAWSGRTWNAVLSPKYVLGESMGASSALQLVLGTLAVRQTQQPVVISMPGANTAAYACVLTP